ncbi:MAG: hypothetical protein F6J90_30695 [Moorea sp. SIOASIH]|uniref:hypothetical protein n=1 Tax=Moorena sp. SIOASIH TaxID=2607817 RepID=UPI0013BB6786|nr:hypothetical protein [Moorena sp. SIOASIH]NEO40473.1 hypothetical protein [Moorena sp. SIOASIH]
MAIRIKSPSATKSGGELGIAVEVKLKTSSAPNAPRVAYGLSPYFLLPFNQKTMS